MKAGLDIVDLVQLLLHRRSHASVGQPVGDKREDQQSGHGKVGRHSKFLSRWSRPALHLRGSHSPDNLAESEVIPPFGYNAHPSLQVLQGTNQFSGGADIAPLSSKWPRVARRRGATPEPPGRDAALFQSLRWEPWRDISKYPKNISSLAGS